MADFCRVLFTLYHLYKRVWLAPVGRVLFTCTHMVYSYVAIAIYRVLHGTKSMRFPFMLNKIVRGNFINMAIVVFIRHTEISLHNQN